MNLHADSDVIIASYLSGKEPGSQVIVRELMGYGITRKQAQDIISYLEEKDMIERRTGGSIFYVGDRDTVSPVQQEPVRRASTYTGLTPGIAFELFDPNPNIFRGVVVEEDGIFPETYKRRRAEIKVLLPDRTEKKCIVSTYRNNAFVTNRRYSSRINDIARKMRKGELVLVRQKGVVPGRNGFFSVEPLFSIEEEDNLTLGGNGIVTRVNNNRIYNLPIVEEGSREPEKRRGIGYILGEDSELTSFYVNGAKESIWSILPEARIRSIGMSKDSSRYYVCEIS